MPRTTTRTTISITKSLLSSLFALVLVGCTSLSTTIPLHSGEGLRSVGESWGLSGGIGNSSTQDVSFTDDASARPPNLTRREIQQSSILSGHLAMGVMEKADVFLKVTPQNTWLYGFRFQPFGQSRTTAERSDFSMAVIAWGFRSATHRSGDQKGKFGPGGHNWNASAVSMGEGIDMLFGYNVKPNVTVFGGPTFMKYRSSGNIHHDRSTDGSSAEADYGFSGIGDTRGVRLGIEWFFSKRASFRLETFYSHFAFEQTSNPAVQGLNLALDF